MNGGLDASDGVHFQESRRLARTWVVLVAVLSAPGLLVTAVVFYSEGGSFSTSDLLVLASVFGVTLVVLAGLWVCRLTTEVRDDGLHVRFFPLQLSFRQVPGSAIRSVSRTNSSPATEFGGVGIRQTPRFYRWGLSFDRPRAYLAGGDESGVRVERHDDPVLVVGTERPAKLAAALERLSDG